MVHDLPEQGPSGGTPARPHVFDQFLPAALRHNPCAVEPDFRHVKRLLELAPFSVDRLAHLVFQMRAVVFVNHGQEDADEDVHTDDDKDDEEQ